MPKEILSPILDPTELFFQDILKYDPLTPEKTKSLLNRVLAGREANQFLSNNGFKSPEERRKQERILQEAKEAKSELILHNLRFVYKVALQKRKQGVLLTDLVAEGAIGLSIAIDHYDPAKAINSHDPSKKTTFLTFAGYWVRRIIQSYIRNNKGQIVVSLNQPFGEDDDSELGEFIEDKASLLLDENIDQMGLEMALADVLQALPPREVFVLQMRFGLIDGKAHTLEEIGEMMPIENKEGGREDGNETPWYMTVSIERARQIGERALSRLREPHRASKLRTFFDGKEK